MEEEVKVLEVADPTKQVVKKSVCDYDISMTSLQESLESEVVPDPMEGEQTWPTDEELRDAEGERSYVIIVYSETDMNCRGVQGKTHHSA